MSKTREGGVDRRFVFSCDSLRICYIYIYLYMTASPLPPAPFLLVAVWVVAGLAKVGIMIIDAKIVRHSQNAVVNIIKKHSK